MEFIEIIITIGKNYLEREKAKEDQARADKNNQLLISTIIENRKIIVDVLYDIEINRLGGLYLGQIENFKEYDSTINEHKNLLLDIAFNTNGDIIGPLSNLFTNSKDLLRTRKIVKLLYLTMILRGHIFAELKNRFGDDRYDHLLEQMKYLEKCSVRVVDEQSIIVGTKYDSWSDCQKVIRPGIVDFVIPGEGDLIEMPTLSCSTQWFDLKKERVFLSEDLTLNNNIKDAITYLAKKV